jgi:transposase InsO family protein
MTGMHKFRREVDHKLRVLRHASQIGDVGKVERSHRTDEQEFYQLLTYTDDVDLQARLSQWEQFYNLSRPHGAFNGKAPYEVLRERL